MKKFFIALSVLAALALSVVPSQALIGIPDDVPGGEIQQAFFVVAADFSGLDTAIVIQEIGNGPAAGGILRWHMFDQFSNHVADSEIPYTRDQVTPVSMASLIQDHVTPGGLAMLLDETTFGIPVYKGYVRWENRMAVGGVNVYANNLVGKMYLHHMAAGQAATVNLAAREYLPAVVPNYTTNATNTIWQPGASAPAGPPAPFPPTGYTGAFDMNVPWLPMQGQAGTVTNMNGDIFAEFGGVEANGAPRFESFSPNSLATSMQKERGYDGLNPINLAFTVNGLNYIYTYYPPYVAPATGFGLYPRFYLHNETAENYIFVWKSINYAQYPAPVGDSWRVDVNFFDEDENASSGFLIIDRELNVIDVRESVPPAFIASYPAAGWINIVIPDVFNNIPALATVAAGTPYPGVAAFAPPPAPQPVYSAAEAAFSGIASVEILAYNWQLANSAEANLNWAGLFQVPRDVNFATR